jgi:hypothetical protein
MAESYLLPCKCGNLMVIEVGQAGQTTACDACGKSIDVPTMRAIRQLQPAYTQEATATKPPWSARQGTVFATGMGIALIALVMATIVVFKIVQMQRLAVKPKLTEEGQRFLAAEIDKLPPDELLNVWHEHVEGTGLGTWEPHIYLLARSELRMWWLFVGVAAVIGVGGVITTISSFFVKTKE